MREFLLFAFLIKLHLSAWGQIGFSKLFDLDFPSTSFYNEVIDQDFNLVVFGIATNNSQPIRQGFLIAKFDTSGNVLSQYTYYDSAGDDYASGVGRNPFIKLKDNSGYVIIGDLLSRSNGVLLIVNNDGTLRFLNEFADEYSLVDFYENILETDDGFIITGIKQDNDFKVNSFIMKIDYLGNKKWERKLRACSGILK